jgi:catechol 2,3-dioxygenase-like lactoylglutathione lyase family enzyme
MITRVAQVALLVDDYARARAFYCGLLGFTVAEDTPLAGGKRWVRLRAPGGEGSELLLSCAVTAAERAAIGQQAGGRVFLFLHTDDLRAEHARLAAAGVRFTEAPRWEPYGGVAVFQDLYGNRIDLIEPRGS